MNWVWRVMGWVQALLWPHGARSVALIGDYALLHSGLNALIDVYEKELPLLCIVMKNNCTAMTGKQPVYDPVRYLLCRPGCLPC